MKIKKSAASVNPNIDRQRKREICMDTLTLRLISAKLKKGICQIFNMLNKFI